MDNKFLWFLIYLILGLAVVWGIGSFIAWDMLWFIHSLIGRVLGVIFFIIILGGAIEESSKW
jgi:type VI protein secretion system component VasK